MPIAYSIIPDRFQDGRHGAIHEGIARAGYRVEHISIGRAPDVSHDDLLLTWTRHKGGKESMCEQFELQGARVLVCEEAYLRRVPAFADQFFAVSWHEHNGAGWFPIGGPERWESFHIDLEPFAGGGELVVVREQRGIGSRAMGSPPNWHGAAAKQIQRWGYPARIRVHPKTRGKLGVEDTPFADLMDSARVVATWASAFGVRALMAGVPVIAVAPRWILASIAGRVLDAEHIASPYVPTDEHRLAAFEELAWGQWRMSELRSGEAFDHLLSERR